MLYNVLKVLIQRGQTDGLEGKIDIFFAAGKLSQIEYEELIGLLPVVGV